MKRSLSLARTGLTMTLLGLLSLVLLQACHSPISQEVKVTCGPSGSMNGDGGPGIGCAKTDVAVHYTVPLDAIVVNDSGVSTGELLPAGAKCDWVPPAGQSNRICANPGAGRCSLVPNATCHTTYNKTNKRCDCGCF
jgi:hypothetical protein